MAPFPRESRGKIVSSTEAQNETFSVMVHRMGGPMSMPVSLGLFVLAGLCEIGGGYLVWQFLRGGKPIGYVFVGGLMLILYGIIPTFSLHISAACTRRTAACLSCCRCCGDGDGTVIALIGSTSLEPCGVLPAWR